MIRRAFKLVLGILLIPIVFFAAINFFKEIAHITALSRPQAMFLYGVIAYLAFHVFIYKPDPLYVFAHETTHALMARLLGGRVFKFKVSNSGGSVGTDKTNTIVALAPYMIPFYSVLTCIVYLAMSFFTDPAKYTNHFIFAIGATLSFHFVLTSEILRIKQSDVVKSGYIFSMCLITLVNLAIMSGILNGLFAEFSFKHITQQSYYDAKEFYIRAYQLIVARIIV